MVAAGISPAEDQTADRLEDTLDTMAMTIEEDTMEVAVVAAAVEEEADMEALAVEEEDTVEVEVATTKGSLVLVVGAVIAVVAEEEEIAVAAEEEEIVEASAVGAEVVVAVEGDQTCQASRPCFPISS
jgi:hypothetical protein